MGFGMIKTLAVKNFEFIFKRSLRKNYQLNICQFKRKVSRADLVLTDMRNPTIIQVQAWLVADKKIKRFSTSQ